MAKKSNVIKDIAKLDEVIRSSLPGWKLSTSHLEKSASLMNNGASVKPPVNLEQLRKKFLGTPNTPTASKKTMSTKESVVIPRRTVRIEPQVGGPSKVADMVAGKITIVQG